MARPGGQAYTEQGAKVKLDPESEKQLNSRLSELSRAMCGHEEWARRAGQIYGDVVSGKKAQDREPGETSAGRDGWVPIVRCLIRLLATPTGVLISTIKVSLWLGVPLGLLYLLVRFVRWSWFH